MISKNDVAIIIPARGGSKGIVNKNIYPILGKPLIQFTIDAAKKTCFRNNIYVTTDSPEIQKLSISLGVQAPYLRDEQLSSDSASTIDVVLDFLKKFSDYKHIILLQPTSPLRTEAHIQEAFDLYGDGKNPLISAKLVNYMPDYFLNFKNNQIIAKKVITHFRRQELSQRAYPNGAIYISSRQSLEKNNSFYTKDTLIYFMDKISSVDIDDMEDIKILEALKKV